MHNAVQTNLNDRIMQYTPNYLIASSRASQIKWIHNAMSPDLHEFIIQYIPT